MNLSVLQHFADLISKAKKPKVRISSSQSLFDVSDKHIEVRTDKTGRSQKRWVKNHKEAPPQPTPAPEPSKRLTVKLRANHQIPLFDLPEAPAPATPKPEKPQQSVPDLFSFDFSAKPESKPSLPAFNPSLPVPTDRKYLVGLPDSVKDRDRTRWNDEAVRILERLEKDGRAASTEEKLILAKYSGNGGIGASLNEFYTPPELAESLWKVLHKLGADQGAGLEPSSGPGVMLQFAPDGASMDAVELSPISAGVAKQVFGEHHSIHNMGFEVFSTSNPDKEFDFLIGNPPFGSRGEMSALDMPEEKECARYFTLRSLDHLKEGGVAVLVLPYGMAKNKNDAELRRRILSRAEVVAIHGLPASVFSRAGTDVATTDVWVLKGRNMEVRAGLEAAGDDGLKALKLWDQSFIDGKWHEAHPEQLHGEHSTNSLGWYIRQGEMTPETLNKIVNLTPVPQGQSHTLDQLLMALEEEGNSAAIAKVNAGVMRDQGLKEGAIRSGKHGLQVCRNGKWHNIETSTGTAFLQGKQLGDLITTHSTLIANHDYEQANSLRPQMAALLGEYLERHGNPHHNKDLQQLTRTNSDLNNLLAAITPDGSIATAFTRDAVPPRGTDLLDPDSVLSVVQHLRSKGTPTHASQISALWNANHTDVQSLFDHLLDEGLVMRPDGQWIPQGEFYVGDAQRLIHQLNEASTRTQDPEFRRVFDLMKAEVQSRSPRKPLEEMNLNPRMGIVPIRAVSMYLQHACTERGMHLGTGFDAQRKHDGKFELTPGYYGSTTAFNFAKRYITGEKRLASEADIYDELDAAFGDWLSQHGFRDAVEDAYAQKHAWLNPVWDVTPLDQKIEGWNPKIKLHPWQNEAANRQLAQGGGITALDVGLGKTFTGIALNLYARQQGMVRKNIIAVPKSVVSKWRADFLKAKPSARVLCIGAEPVLDEDGQVKLDEYGQEVWKEVAGAAALDRQLSRMKTEDWDAVIMTHDTLKRVPLSATRRLELIESEFEAQHHGTFYSRPGGMPKSLHQQYAALKAKAMLENGEISLDDLKEASVRVAELDLELKAYSGKKNLSSNQKKDKAAKKEERARASFFATANSLMNSKNNDLSTTWEELGIDQITVDEAHEYKGLWQPTSGRETIKYLGAGETSQQAIDLYYKCMELRQRTGGRGVYLLTATPIKNSPVELYSMLSYTMPEMFKSAGIHNVDQFIDRYCDIQTEIHLNTQGDNEPIKTLVGLKNLRELRELAARVINQKTAVQVGLKLPREVADYRLHRPTHEQAQLIEHILQNPLESIGKYMGRVDIPGDIESWKVSDDAQKRKAYEEMFSRFRLVLAHLLRRAELDLEMLEPEKHRGYVSPKVESMLQDLTVRMQDGKKAVLFCDTKDMPDPGSALMDDEGSVKRKNPNGYSFHAKLRQLISERTGIKPEQIAIANADTAPTPEHRLEISNGIASGKYRVVIGNTATAGQGMDLQIGVTDLMHLDVPWNPADLQQRNGRVLRQGNTSERVNNTFYLGTRGLDKHMTDILRGKTNWYEEFWQGEGDSIRSNNQSVIPSAEEIAALSLSDDEERARALDALAEKQKADRVIAERIQALGTFKKLQSAIRGLIQHEIDHRKDLTPTQQRTRDSLKKQIEDYKRRLHGSEAFKPYVEHLEHPTRVMIEPHSGHAFQSGQQYLIHEYGGLYAFQVTHLDHKKGQLHLTPFMPDDPPGKNNNQTQFVAVDRMKDKELMPYHRGEHLRSHVTQRGVPNSMTVDPEGQPFIQEALRARAERNRDSFYLVRRQGQLMHVKGSDLKPTDQFHLKTGPHAAEEAAAYLNDPKVKQEMADLAGVPVSRDLRYSNHTVHTTLSQQGFDVAQRWNEDRYVVKSQGVPVQHTMKLVIYKKGRHP